MTIRKFLIASVLAAGVAAPAMAQTPPTIMGRWIGKYVCNQGVTALHLTISKHGRDGIAADFAFNAARENPEVPSGAYRMEGTYNAKTRAMDLKGVSWKQQPFLYVMVDLKGAMDANGERLTGDVLGPGCTIFELYRPTEKIS